jgi:HEPN domain-containing protein
MNTSLSHLSAAKRGQLETITKIIRRAIRPEKIILFGVHSVTGAGAEIFASRQLPASLGSYDLLVVTGKGDRRSDHELQDIIENRCQEQGPVTVLVHDINYVNSRLAEGHYFFTTIRQEAILLYDAGRTPFADAGQPDWGQVLRIAQKDFERWGLQALAFYRSAVFNVQQKEWRIAVFLLHQSAEHIYQAILLAFNGYKPTTHNLDKLRRYTNRFSIELALLFPRDSEEEDRLFRLLLQGYVDARYKEEYTISEKEVGVLSERIARLLAIAGRVCRNRLISLEKMVAGI